MSNGERTQTERPYAGMATDDLRSKLAGWERMNPADTFDPQYMRRVKRMAVRGFRAELRARGL